jgi:hypothetical protein
LFSHGFSIDNTKLNNLPKLIKTNQKMSAPIQNNNNNAITIAEKVKKPALSAQSTKHMVFGNWLIERLVAGAQLPADSVTESRKILGMWSSVEEQIALYDGFTADLKTNTKELKTLIRQFHKPPKAAKKAKTAASEGEKKRGRKKKDVVDEQDPMLALNERLVAAAQSDEPIVDVPNIEYVRAPKDPEPTEINTPEPLSKEELAKPAKPTKPAKEPKKKVAKTDAKAVKDDAKTDAEPDAEKPAAKAEEKAAKVSAKAEEKAAKDAAKLSAKAEEKAAKDAAKAAEKAAKDAAKAAEKAAKPIKPTKAAKKADEVLPIPLLVRNSPEKLNREEEEEEEEELECEIFQHNGVDYLRDDDNNIYDKNTQVIIGTFDTINLLIVKH